MSELHFDREDVGIVENQHWTDAQHFINVSHGVAELRGEATSNVSALPRDTVGGAGKTTNDGTASLKKQGSCFVDTMKSVVLELSDACSVLGSGTKTAIANMDATESQATHDFEFILGAN